MDAFYAAIEQRDRPELVGQPVIIGADPKGGRGRGVVSTASYEARRFGVGSAMPISKAWQLCPKGVYLQVDMQKYISVSRQVMEILRRFTDVVEPISIDEAFLDVTLSRRALGDGETIARLLKQAIRDDTKLTASVGVASCKLVAKIASDMRKPDGLVLVPPGTEASFLAPLPIRRLWGVGPKTEERLLKVGLATIGALASCPPETLARRLGTHGHDMQVLARGEDDREVVAHGEEAKSVGAEHTFDVDTADRERLRQTLLELSDSVARRLRKSKLKARTIMLKYRDETFRTQTRAETVAHATDVGAALFEVAWRAFQGVHGARKVRLLGIYTSGFGKSEQLDLFGALASPADRLRDAVASRLGKDALTRASLLDAPQRGAPGPATAGRRSRRDT
jgi:nucleotidyltransferase/DNA polymerase involved in DNA repair